MGYVLGENHVVIDGVEKTGALLLIDTEFITLS
jgi:hypothetical protein